MTLVAASLGARHVGRFFAASIHFIVSLLVAALGALLIFKLWYPPPFDELAGGIGLFCLLVSVDVVLGPALTLVAASPGKPGYQFRRDLAVIVIVQALAFAYGIFTIAAARPLALSFEVDRFRVVTAADIDLPMLEAAPSDLRSLSWVGPKYIAAVKPTDPVEQIKSIELGMSGIDLSMVPRNWRTYASQSGAAWDAARPASKLMAQYPQLKDGLDRIEAEAKVPVADLRFLPVLSRRASQVAIIAQPDARIVGYLTADGFF